MNPLARAKRKSDKEKRNASGSMHSSRRNMNEAVVKLFLHGSTHLVNLAQKYGVRASNQRRAKVTKTTSTNKMTTQTTQEATLLEDKGRDKTSRNDTQQRSETWGCNKIGGHQKNRVSCWFPSNGTLKKYKPTYYSASL